MPKHNTKLRIATSFQRWQEIDGQVDEAVANLINGDTGNAERLLLLLEYLSGEQYDPQDRALVAFEVGRRAFTHTNEFESAYEAYLNRINPDRAQGPRAVKTA